MKLYLFNAFLFGAILNGSTVMAEVTGCLTANANIVCSADVNGQRKLLFQSESRSEILTLISGSGEETSYKINPASCKATVSQIDTVSTGDTVIFYAKDKVNDSTIQVVYTVKTLEGDGKNFTKGNVEIKNISSSGTSTLNFKSCSQER